MSRETVSNSQTAKNILDAIGSNYEQIIAHAGYLGRVPNRGIVFLKLEYASQVAARFPDVDRETLLEPTLEALFRQNK